MTDHTACQAAYNALYECAVEIMENPPGIGTQRFWLDSRLGTMGHMLNREGWADLLRERDRYRAALEHLMEFGKRLMNSDDEDERGIGCCIAEGARVIEDD